MVATTRTTARLTTALRTMAHRMLDLLLQWVAYTQAVMAVAATGTVTRRSTRATAVVAAGAEVALPRAVTLTSRLVDDLITSFWLVQGDSSVCLRGCADKRLDV
jgi:hypothetical protein